LVALVPLLVLAGSAPFTVRGYTLTRESLLVHRLGWTTMVPLDDLQSAEFDPFAMQKSLRVVGNGGLFSFSGYFTNKTLGSYRALVTDPLNAVVLRFSNKTLVVSPDAAQTFVEAIRNRQAFPTAITGTPILRT
ncbi:MAG: PH domain-containing protein, partial [Firmicutes bacterium]|nr:PH domain-containing protein [Bacillota bacterium]